MRTQLSLTLSMSRVSAVKLTDSRLRMICLPQGEQGMRQKCATQAWGGKETALRLLSCSQLRQLTCPHCLLRSTLQSTPILSALFVDIEPVDDGNRTLSLGKCHGF